MPSRDVDRGNLVAATVAHLKGALEELLKPAMSWHRIIMLSVLPPSSPDSLSLVLIFGRTSLYRSLYNHGSSE